MGGKIKRLVGIVLLSLYPCWLWGDEVLPTPLEERDYQALPNSHQIGAFLQRLADYSPKAELLTYGRSAGDRPLMALLLSNDFQFLRQGESAPGKLKVLLVGGQHGTEPSGSEALQSLARDIAWGSVPSVLEHLDLIVIPNSNPDGRDASRRVNAGGVNLSTDYVLLSQPETQALVRLLDRFRPHVLLDVHESAVLKKKSLGAQGYLTDFEAQFEFANHPNVAPELRLFAAHVFLPELLDAVNALGLPAQHYIGEITSIHQPITHGGISLRNLRNYAGMQGVFSFLVENRLDPPGDWPSWRNIQVRVAKQRICLLAFLEKLIEFRENLLRRIAHNLNHPNPTLVALRAFYAPSPSQPKIKISLRRLQSGEGVTREFAYHGQIVAKEWVFRPKAYAITAHQRELAQLLDRHNIDYRRITHTQSARCRCQRVVKVKTRRWRQGVIVHQEVQVDMLEEVGQIRLKPGDLVIDFDQPKGSLAFLLLDPCSSTSMFHRPPYAAWLAEGKEHFGVPLW